MLCISLCLVFSLASCGGDGEDTTQTGVSTSADTPSGNATIPITDGSTQDVTSPSENTDAGGDESSVSTLDTSESAPGAESGGASASDSSLTAKAAEQRSPLSADSLFTGEGSVDVGMSAAQLRGELGDEDAILNAAGGGSWYIFGTDTYDDFAAVYVKNDTVCAAYCGGCDFEFKGVRFGSVITSGSGAKFYTDANASGSVYAVSIGKMPAGSVSGPFDGECMLSLHLTNAYRACHGLAPLTFSEKAAGAAYAHSEDMAKKNYFSHTSSDGTSFSERLKQRGVSYTACAENIAAGMTNAAAAHDGWVNSAGHRENLLNAHVKFFGAGACGLASSLYGVYWTQDFYA